MTTNQLLEFEAMAKFDLPEDERELLLKNASVLEESFDKMNLIDTTDTEPLISVSSLKNILREDISSQMLPREEILKNAPEQDDGYFRVPKTMD